MSYSGYAGEQDPYMAVNVQWRDEEKIKKVMSVCKMDEEMLRELITVIQIKA